MGLFSSKKKVSVSASTVPLIGQSPDFVQKAVLSSLIKDTDIVEEIINESMTGAASKIQNALKYAKSTYALGLPEGYTEYLNFDDTAVKAVLEGIHGEPVQIDQIVMDFDEPDIFLYSWLYDHRGYNYLTDEVDTFPQELQNQIDAFAATVKTNFTNELNTLAAQTLATAGNNGAPVVTYGIEGDFRFRDVAVASVTVDSTLQDVLTQVKNTQRDLEFTSTSDVSQFTATYVGTATPVYTGTVALTWTVTREQFALADSGHTSPLSSTVFSYSEVANHTWNETTEVSGSDVFSLAYPRTDYFYGVAYRVGDQKRIWKYRIADETYPSLNFGAGTQEGQVFYPVVVFRRDNQDMFDPARAGDVLYETSKELLRKMDINAQQIADAINENPDVGQIDHAYLMFATRLMTDNPACIEYLARFFDRYESDGDYLLIKEIYDRSGGEADRIAYILQYDFNISRKDPRFTPLINQVMNYSNFQMRIQEYGLDIALQWSFITVDIVDGRHGEKDAAVRYLHEDHVEFRWQYEPNRYKRIKVYHPKLVNYIYGTHAFHVDISDLFEEDTKNNFIIPLHIGILDEMNTLAKNTLYYDCIQLVFNSYEITKVKWYQRSFFRVLVTIAGIALFIYTGGASAILAELAAGAYLAAATLIIEAILISIAVSYAFKLVVKAIGMDAAMLLAVIATVFAFVQLNQAGWDFGQAASAQNLLFVANGITNGIQANLADLFADLGEEMDLFAAESEEKMNALKEAQELLDFDGLLDPFEFIRSEPMINFNESPSDYYHRTIHSGNIGTYGFEAVRNYTDIALTLPQPNYTLNGMNYA